MLILWKEYWPMVVTVGVVLVGMIILGLIVRVAV